LLEAGRGAACLAVLLFHSLSAYGGPALPRELAAVGAVAGWGWLGVHVFFAISGWCLAERTARARKRGESGAHFAAERVLRIYPTYLAALLISIALRLAALPFNTSRLSSAVPAGWAGWLAAASLTEPYVGRPDFLTVSWSLVYELGFYLCCAAALVAVARRLATGPLLFLAGSLLCFAPWVAHAAGAPWRVLALWPDFFAGMAAWWAVRRSARAGCAVLALMLAASIAWPGYGGAGRLTAIGTAAALALAWPWDAGLTAGPVMRSLMRAGGISYSLYLIHVPLISPCENLMGRLISPSSRGFIAVWALAIALALAGAVCLNRVVERPVERWRRRAL
jgi:peptidoglycan/LPS O-acetylase OafA/YrhL